MPYVIDDGFTPRLVAGRSGAKGSSTTCGDQPRAVRPADDREFCGSGQRSVARPTYPADPVELPAVDDVRYVAGGVVAGVRDAAQPDRREPRPWRTTSGRWWCSHSLGWGRRLPGGGAHAPRRSLPRSVPADRHVAAPYADPVQGHHAGPPALGPRQVGDVLLGPEVVQGVAGPRGSSAPKAMNWTGSSVGAGRHRRQLEHDGDPGGVVLRAGRDRHGVEVGADHDVRRRVEARGSAITFSDVPRRPACPRSCRPVPGLWSAAPRSRGARTLLTKSAAWAKLREVASRGPMSSARWRCRAAQRVRSLPVVACASV